LKEAELKNITLAVFTDGSAIHADTEKARARSGIFMADESSIAEFVRTDFNRGLEKALMKERESSRDSDTDISGRAAERIIEEMIKKFKDNHECIIFSGEITEGPIQSWFGEYMAVYQALRKVAKYPNNALKIYTDHLSLARLFKYITSCSSRQLSAMGKVNGLPLLSAITNLELKRKKCTTITWVKAHSGIFGNAVADYSAGQNCTDPERIPLHQHFECPDTLIDHFGCPESRH
jgi:ribonuclease HI